MKLYYIASGYRRPIDILDNALIKALTQRFQEVSFFCPTGRRIRNCFPTSAAPPRIMC